ncbi:hypothetical protein EDEG_05084 [Edhazardia aedis USNM 41457]|uniref:CHCH domain-containing protein n=1 Tax=Edhazardia aedis (strain USNM 41457) TaxID=1003232 RepID=A0A0L1P6D1_EDHAE|nr:hypothetical protein EDEG_05084 [Edhazardia aedis USNM 41457]|eukprot:KNH48532.1 hypothetical protein EDEG_05084 [Edhazardia aedis USNM 41457]
MKDTITLYLSKKSYEEFRKTSERTKKIDTNNCNCFENVHKDICKDEFEAVFSCFYSSSSQDNNRNCKNVVQKYLNCLFKNNK